jgi:hypothetical protein
LILKWGRSSAYGRVISFPGFTFWGHFQSAPLVWAVSVADVKTTFVSSKEGEKVSRHKPPSRLRNKPNIISYLD